MDEQTAQKFRTLPLPATRIVMFTPERVVAAADDNRFAWTSAEWWADRTHLPIDRQYRALSILREADMVVRYDDEYGVKPDGQINIPVSEPEGGRSIRADGVFAPNYRDPKVKKFIWTYRKN